ncbi:MAG: hypothetical protein HZA51_05860 [Planctomycetes bacterium]|nr:hypothetical protein [Planctomycetota bacterium]
MAIFGSQGIRDAMTKSYHKHISDLDPKKIPDGTSLHQAALYGALATRYIVSLKPKAEVVVWLEIAPFMRLPSNDAVNALAEYVVYKEMPTEARVATLTSQVRKGWSLLPQEEQETLKAVAEINGVAWLSLL